MGENGGSSPSLSLTRTLGSWMNAPPFVFGGMSPVVAYLRHSMMVCRGEKHMLVSHQCHPRSASFPPADRLAAAVVTDNDSEGRVELDHVDLLVVKGADAPKGHLCQGCGEKAATERHPSPLPHCPRTPSWHHCEGAQLWSRCWLENKVLDAWVIRACRGLRCKTTMMGTLRL